MLNLHFKLKNVIFNQLMNITNQTLLHGDFNQGFLYLRCNQFSSLTMLDLHFKPKNVILNQLMNVIDQTLLHGDFNQGVHNEDVFSIILNQCFKTKY